MAAHAGQHMMAVLPCGSGEHQIGLGVDTGKDIHAHALAGDEPMSAARINREGASHGNACVLETLRQPSLQILLCGPANLIGR